MSELSRWQDKFEIEYYAKNPDQLPPEFTPENIDIESSKKQFMTLFKVNSADIAEV